MRLLRSVRVRLFVVVWAVCSLHFATNIVREHYPAFALAQHGNLRCDDWVIESRDPAAPSGVRVTPLHPDLFRHVDGHWYANNNAGASLVAAPLLVVFEPLLAQFERIGKRQAAARPAASPGGDQPAQYDTEYPLRQRFMAEVTRRGLQLRLGAAAALTAVLLMAPAAALLALLVHDWLRRRGVAPGRAVTLTLLFAFATPLVFRSAILNHNQLEAAAAFAAFALLSRAPSAGVRGRFLAAGVLGGATVLFDYSGVVLLAALLAWAFVVARHARAGVRRSLVAFVAGAALPLALLAFTQWWQFGDPFRPAQRWMPDAHFSVRGYHGFDLPSPDLLWKNLFDPSYGLFAFAPLLLLALVPASALGPAHAADGRPLAPAIVSARSVPSSSRCPPRSSCSAPPTSSRGCSGTPAFARSRRWCRSCSCWRARRSCGLSPRALALIGAPCVLHSWVLAMARATPPLEPASFAESTVARSWRAFFENGIELPWLTVWRRTQPHGGPAWTALVAPLLVCATIGALALLWRAGARAAAGAPA